MANLLNLTLTRFTVKRFTVKYLSKPLVCVGLFAAGGLLAGSTMSLAQEVAQEKAQQSSALDAIFSGQEMQITPMPPLLGRATQNGLPGNSTLQPLRPVSAAGSAQSPGSATNQTPVYGTTNAIPLQELLTPMSSDAANGATTQYHATPQQPVSNAAKMLIGNAQLQPVPPTTKSNSPQFMASQTSFQQSAEAVELDSEFQTIQFSTAQSSTPQVSEPTQQSETPNQLQPQLEQPVQHPVARVAEMKRHPIPTGTMNGIHQLRNLTMGDFETALVSAWGDDLQASASQDGRYVRVELPNRVSKRLAMMIDRETQELRYEGDASLQKNWHQIVAQLDYQPSQQLDGTFHHISLISAGSAAIETVRHAAFLMGMYHENVPAQTSQQQGGANAGQADTPSQTDDPNVTMTLPAGTKVSGQEQLIGGQDVTQRLKSKVQILEDPDTGMITLIGEKEDLAIVREIISQIAAESQAAKPTVERIPLKNIQSESVDEQIQEMYDASYQKSEGNVTIKPLTTPNSLIVIGQDGAIEAVKNIVRQMDVESTDQAMTDGFKSFRLKHISAADAKVRLDTFFGQVNTSQGDNRLPSVPVITVADFRSNTLTVKGSQQSILEAASFIEKIDVTDSDAANVVKVVPLKNTLAEDLAIVIQDAINGQQANAGQGYNPNQQAQLNQQNQGANIAAEESHLRSPALILQTIGKDGRVLESGILFDVRVTADRNSNSLVISAPRESIDLVLALVEQLDRIPAAETQIKVFQIFNGDAETLLDMLEALFQASQQGGGFGAQGTGNLSQLPLQGASQSEGSSLINLRFAVDLRTNSIIASGPAGDLIVVEDLLNRLDERDINERQVIVHRLSNAPVLDVADAINTWLDSRADIIANDPRAVGGLNQTNREVIVVPEVVSNSLIIQARPEYMIEISEIIRSLDRRPPMVKVKVMIAEIDLNRLEEFGVDIGVQDSLLFDRGTSVAADGSIGGIGFPFNGSATANRNATFQETLAGQALSNLATGRINSDLGYGGLVLSAGNESINILMRALKDKQCARVLSKPHIMTIENLQGRVSIGAEVPRVSGTTNTNFGITQDIDFIDVGVILEVTPRVSPDGMIVMAVNAKKSSVGPDETGIVIAIGADGTPIRSPQIIETEANTTLMARSGQTVVFSGLIQETKNHVERGAPILSDLPVIGPLFKYESDSASRTELLIILTPYLVTDDDSLDRQNYDEMDRMHWCLSDVAEVYGNTDYEGYQGTEDAVETYYPDSDPAGLQPEIYTQPLQTNEPVMVPASIQHR